MEGIAAFHDTVNSEMGPVWESNGSALLLGEEEKAEIFIRCLKAVTSEDVFNRFAAEVEKQALLLNNKIMMEDREE